MRLKVIRADDTLNHIALAGRLDIDGVKDIQYEFLHTTTVGVTATIVDLSQVTYIASLGMGMLVSAAKHVERSGARMVLLNPSPFVRKALELMTLGRVIPIADDLPSALERLRPVGEAPTTGPAT